MTLSVFSDEYFMGEALKEAGEAYTKEEIPIGSVIVCKNRIIARGHNLTEQLNDVTAHAEMISITSASNHLGSKYLNECTIYVTLEPCAMCASALHWAQMGKLVFGAYDSKKGFSVYQPFLLHPKTEVKEGVLAKECGQLLKKFFAGKR